MTMRRWRAVRLICKNRTNTVTLTKNKFIFGGIDNEF